MTEHSPGTAFDLVVKGGRVFDPGAGIDEVADIGIWGG